MNADVSKLMEWLQSFKYLNDEVTVINVMDKLKDCLTAGEDSGAKIACSNGLEPLSFAEVFTKLAKEVNQVAIEKGWWKGERNEGELICLMHSELSEALGALRHGNPPDDHIPEFAGVEAELADVVIRIMDFAAAKGYRVGEAVEAKIAYDKDREHMHGGKRF